MRSFLLLAFSLFSLTAFPQDARTEFNQGIRAYNGGNYEQAAQHFRRASELAPDQPTPRLYLATSYAQMYIPGAETPENIELGEQAIAAYKKVLEIQPRNISAEKGIADLYLQMKHWDDARRYYAMASEADPSDPANYFSQAVIDWTESYQLRMKIREELKLKPSDTNFIDLSECWYVRGQNLERVEDGIKLLTRAIQLRPDYDDAMAYMNLMYRERADIQCGNRAAYAKDSNAADKWVDVTMATKKSKARPRQPQ